MKRNTQARLMFYALIHTLMPRFGIKSKSKEKFTHKQRTRVSTLEFEKHIDRAKNGTMARRIARNFAKDTFRFSY